jgi:hypothetical protein
MESNIDIDFDYDCNLDHCQNESVPVVKNKDKNKIEGEYGKKKKEKEKAPLQSTTDNIRFYFVKLFLSDTQATWKPIRVTRRKHFFYS